MLREAKAVTDMADKSEKRLLKLVEDYISGNFFNGQRKAID